MQAYICILVVEAKLGIFKYNNKRLYHETRLIFILKNKQQNKNNSKFTQYGHHHKILFYYPAVIN